MLEREFLCLLVQANSNNKKNGDVNVFNRKYLL